MDADFIRGVPVGLLPSDPFTPQPMPSADTCDDVGLYLDPKTLTVNWKKTNFACGPSALSENMGLSGSTYNVLASAPGSDGMRGGLAAYIPRGVWNVYGRVLIAAKSGVQYVVHVWQGHTLSLTRPGIVSEEAEMIGGGCGTGSGGDDSILEVGFVAHMIDFPGGPTQANEILVTVYPKCSGPAGAALATITPDASGKGYLPANQGSSFMIYRVRGI